MNRFAHISFLFFFFLINNLSVQANPRSFECHLSLEVTAEPGSNLLPPPLFSGPDSVCLGATYTYNSASIPTATYFWVASGGTIISGTSSPSCQVIWNMLPGQLTLYRTLSSNTIFETLPVAASAFPPLNLGPDLTLCTGDSVILDAGPGYTSYLWSSGGTNQKDTLITAGLFSVIVQGCTNQTAYDTILITSIPIIQPNLGPDTAICAGTSIQLSGSTPGINVFIWSNGAITPTITTNIPATYSLITQDSNGCQGRDTLVLNNYPTAPAFVNSPGPVCDSATLSNASILPDPSHLSYLWSNGATANNTNYLPGNHYVIITDTFSCTDTTTFNIGSFNHISVNLGNDTIMCPDTILTLDAGPGYISYDWGNSSTGRTQLVVTGDTFHVEVLDVNGCTSADTIIITMPTDCVFPGDANQDGIANNSDILALGVAFGEQGPRRPAASSQWYGQACPNWANGFLNGPNYKHADCNSDSIVNQDDTLAVLLNYGQMHNKTSHTNASGVDINVVADFDSVMAGDTAIFIVQMADSLAPADSIYGIAFTVNYDTATVDSQGMLYADFSNCWMGSLPNNLMTFVLPFAPVPEVDMAAVRINGTDTSGYGEVCRMGFVTIDNISGKRLTLAKSLNVWLTDVHLVTKDYLSLETSTSGDSTIVYQDELSRSTPLKDNLPLVFPNPTKDKILVRLPQGDMDEIVLYDLQGRRIKKAQKDQNQVAIIDVLQLKNGIYFIEIRSNSWVFRQKVVVQH